MVGAHLGVGFPPASMQRDTHHRTSWITLVLHVRANMCVYYVLSSLIYGNFIFGPIKVFNAIIIWNWDSN